MADWIEVAAEELWTKSIKGRLVLESDFAAIIRRHYEQAAKCRVCDGTGRLLGYATNAGICPRCGGKGRIVR